MHVNDTTMQPLVLHVAIRCGEWVHSPQGDETAIGMCQQASVAMCIMQFYDCMIANKSQLKSPCALKPYISDLFR